MRRQRNILQTKEQVKNPQDQINEEEMGKLPEKEFRVMIVKMIQNLGNIIDKIQETFNKDLESFYLPAEMQMDFIPVDAEATL